jgi:hypothetical protein
LWQCWPPATAVAGYIAPPTINLHCENQILKYLLYLLLLIPNFHALADHQPEAEWSWHVLSAGADESRLSVYRGQLMFGIYNIDCDLTNAIAGERTDDNASINLVKPETSPAGLLIISCNVGAHSQQVEIIDFGQKSTRAAFSVTGSYTARWELQDGELWIGFDEPCDTGPTVECPDGFVTTFVQYPQAEAGN